MYGAKYSAGAKKKKKSSSAYRIVLLGKTGCGKSATGNTILGREAFQSEACPTSWTLDCKRVDGDVQGKQVAVVDTPGLFDTNFTGEEVLKKIETCLSLAAPGPHVFLVVVRLGRFTKEEEETLKIILETFGEEVAKYSILLFTHGDKLKKQTIEQFMSKSEALTSLVEGFSNKYHVFNNESKDVNQTVMLLEKIEKIILDNEGKCYTKKMFRRAKRASKKEKQKVSKALKAMEQQRRNTLKAEVEHEMNLTGKATKNNKCVVQ